MLMRAAMVVQVQLLIVAAIILRTPAFLGVKLLNSEFQTY